MQNKPWKYRLIFAAAILFWTNRSTSAQQILFRFDGSQAGETLGAVVSSLGDLDGDGIPDIGASAPLASGGIHPDGQVIVYSGATGDQLFHFDPVEPRGMCWAMASAGDIDQDGVPDILCGAPYTAPEINTIAGLLYGAGSTLVYPGRMGDVLFLFDGDEQGGQLGHSVDGLKDIDGDGVPDIIIGAPYTSAMGRTGVGSATVRSGGDGQVIFKFDGANPGDYLGWAVAGIDDIDGDGVPDMIIAAPYASPGGRAQAGQVFVHSGATGELIFQLDGEEASANFGSSVATAWDIDGDGVPDIIIGAPGASPRGKTQAGSVFVYSGATRKLIFRFDGPESFDGFGASVAGGQDVDGDHVPDIIIGAPSASPDGKVGGGSAFVFSGAAGDLIFRFDGRAGGDSLGTSVAAAGDLNGDGRSEVIVGSPYSSPDGKDGAGSVFVLSYP